MKKKISLMLCLIMMALGLSACGIDKENFDFYGLTYTDCEQIVSGNVEALASMSVEELAYYEANSDEVYANLFSGWNESTADLGAYQGLGEFTLTEAQDTLTLEQIAKFEDREVCVTFILEYNYETKQVEIADTNADLVYTLGEKMTKAALNTLMGMGTVFVVLILISLIIYCFRFISVLQKKLSGSKEEKKADDAVVTQIEQREEQQLTDDLELVAVISAAIAASAGTSADSFVVRSIRRR